MIAPQRCWGCRSRAAAPWCDRCAALVRIVGDACIRCAGSTTLGHHCWPRQSPVSATVAAFDYGGPIAAAVRSGKLSGAWKAWTVLAHGLADAIVKAGVDVDVVTWIATAKRRVSQRGYDHAELLANAVGEKLTTPVVAPAHMAGVALPASTVLLVDDVVTTGATAWVAAQRLRDAGAGHVTLGVVARAGHHPLGPPPQRRASLPSVPALGNTARRNS